MHAEDLGWTASFCRRSDRLREPAAHGAKVTAPTRGGRIEAVGVLGDAGRPRRQIKALTSHNVPKVGKVLDHAGALAEVIPNQL